MISKYAIRNWHLYILRCESGLHYVGITGKKDFMARILEHGGRKGAKVLRDEVVEEIVEIQHLGIMTRLQAEKIEEDFTRDYRKVFGRHKSKGGYNATVKTPIIPNYAPGSRESIIFLLCSLTIALTILAFIIVIQKFSIRTY